MVEIRITGRRLPSLPPHELPVRQSAPTRSCRSLIADRNETSECRGRCVSQETSTCSAETAVISGNIGLWRQSAANGEIKKFEISQSIDPVRLHNLALSIKAFICHQFRDFYGARYPLHAFLTTLRFSCLKRLARDGGQAGKSTRQQPDSLPPHLRPDVSLPRPLSCDRDAAVTRAA